jgi:hypothetical protein
MALLEMLYGHRCRTSLFWNEIGEGKISVPDILQDVEKQVHIIREKLRVVQSRQKSYAHHKRRELSFEDRYLVYLKISPIKVCTVSRYEASSRRGSLDHSRFWRREVK